jgi:tetratricopeptide (TPR) repeat protein
MRELLDRQLSALMAAVLAAVGTLEGAAVPESTPKQELEAAKLVEATLFAQNPTAEARRKMQLIFADLEAKHPLDPEIKNAFGEFLWNIDEQRGAIGKWEAAERLNPKNAIVLTHLGGAHLANGKARRAFEYFTRATHAEPTSALYHLNLANVAFVFRHDLPVTEQAAFELAREHFAEASRLAPGNSDYARAYAELFYSLPRPDWQSALAAWEHFKEITNNKDFALVNLARVHMKLGQKEAARMCLSDVQGADFKRLKERLTERLENE